MSGIATFTRLPISALPQLEDAIVPTKRWFAAPKDSLPSFLREVGTEAATYEWSGYVLATLLPYLQETHKIDLMTSKYDAIANGLSKARGVACFILTSEHRAAYLGRLNAIDFSEQSLCDYYEKFNETIAPDVGKPMLDGIRAFEACLGQVDANSVILFVIG